MENLMAVNDLLKVAEMELTYRNFVKPSQRPQVTGAQSAYNCFIRIWEEDKIEFVEQFKIMLLNRASKVLGIVPISSGSVSGTIADIKLIFGAALKANACAIILAHNHPSGNLQPSEADLQLTRKISDAGRILEVNALDHLIITAEGFYSMADEGVI